MGASLPEERGITAVVADDHTLLRSGMIQILRDNHGVAIVGEASDGIAAISLVKQHRPVLLTLDIAMPLAQGIEVYAEARRWSPETKIIVFTGQTSIGLLSELVTCGVDGLFMKNGDLNHLVKAVPLILNGAKVIAPEVTEILSEHDDSRPLSIRERQILSLIARGCSNREISEMIGVSLKTVDNHRTNLMRKLDVHSVAELLSHALREGLLDGQKEL